MGLHKMSHNREGIAEIQGEEKSRAPTEERLRNTGRRRTLAWGSITAHGKEKKRGGEGSGENAHTTEEMKSCCPDRGSGRSTRECRSQRRKHQKKASRFRLREIQVQRWRCDHGEGKGGKKEVRGSENRKRRQP